MTNASVAIDYLSFTVDLVNKIDELDMCVRVLGDQFITLFGRLFYDTLLMQTTGWETVAGKTPYKYGYHNSTVGVFIHLGGHANALIQFSGQGCKFLAKNKMLHELVPMIADRVTRLDIAIDIKTETMPADFIGEGYNNRIKSNSIRNSGEGQTVYLGSRHSEKYCRVYRYHAPHPRHEKLRVEYETKKKYARGVAHSIAQNGLEATAQSITEYYKWGSKEMPTISELTEAIQVETASRSNSKTLLWLMKQCAPAFQRLVKEGAIENPQEFVDKYFMPEEKQNDHIKKIAQHQLKGDQ